MDHSFNHRLGIQVKPMTHVYTARIKTRVSGLLWFNLSSAENIYVGVNLQSNENNP